MKSIKMIDALYSFIELNSFQLPPTSFTNPDSVLVFINLICNFKF